VKFKYRKIPDNTNPSGYQRLPLLQVELFYGAKHTGVRCLIDTGASDCIFHSSIADILGIDLKSGKPKPYTGIGGQSINAYLHQIQMRIQGFSEKIHLDAAFTEENQVPLLRQTGFFDNYRVTFERYRGRFEIKGRTLRSGSWYIPRIK
jgi:Aspartyl protease